MIIIVPKHNMCGASTSYFDEPSTPIPHITYTTTNSTVDRKFGLMIPKNTTVFTPSRTPVFWKKSLRIIVWQHARLCLAHHYHAKTLHDMSRCFLVMMDESKDKIDKSCIILLRIFDSIVGDVHIPDFLTFQSLILARRRICLKLLSYT